MSGSEIAALGATATRRCGKLRWELLSVLCDCDEGDRRQQQRVADFVFADIEQVQLAGPSQAPEVLRFALHLSL